MSVDGRDQPLRFLIHDRDAKFSGGFDPIFESEGIAVIRTPVQVPNANAHAERWVGSVRRECLDRLLIFNRRQLEHVLRTYADHYNHTGRTARSRSNLPTNTQRRPSPSRHGESANTNYSAASSTNTRRPHDHRSRP
jgi:putative transposase